MGILNRDILRLLDANLNRATEGVRVLEEAARMLRNDDILTRELKELRHSLAGTVRSVDGLDSRLLMARDSEGDVLREGDTPSERTRADLGSVIRANAGRAEEAVRSLEEYVKLLRPELSVRFKNVRFGLYDVEKKLGALLRIRETLDAYRLGVVVVIDRAETGDADISALVRTVADAGAGTVVYRDFISSGDDSLRNAERAALVLRDGDAAFFIGGHPDVALLTGADGLMLDPGDLPPDRCRTLVGREMAVCVSSGADYVWDCPPEADCAAVDFDGEVSDDFRACVLRLERPVVAMGRLDAAEIGTALRHGASGVGIRFRRADLPGLSTMVAGARRAVELYIAT